MRAREVKDALRRRHPTDANRGGMVGEWTCIEEWLGVDLLALSAWSKAHVIGYEVKVSRSDMRRELLRPGKRVDAVSRTTEFYFAVPDGLFTEDELAFIEPEWGDDDFERARCPGVPAFGPPKFGRGNDHLRWGGRCQGRYARGRRDAQPFQVRLPVPAVATVPEYAQQRLGESDESWLQRNSRLIERQGEADVDCPTCGGKGYVDRARAEAEAPTLWVPRDVGLVTVNGRGCHVAKRAPKRKDPKPIAATRKQINDLARWVSHRPDPRHLRDAPLLSAVSEDAA